MYLFKSIGGGPNCISKAAQAIQKSDRLSLGCLCPFRVICPCFVIFTI